MKLKDRTRLSKYLSLILRHQPERIGLELGEGGWVLIEDLIRRSAAQGRAFTRAELDEVVDTNSKQRFAISRDGNSIRASQGHSVGVDLDYQASSPPKLLYHGTVAAAVESIRSSGIDKRKRHHVHLSPERTTAELVGQRRGRPVILVVRAVEMAEGGHVFFESANGVWLTDHVPPEFIDFPSA